jgi:hypothetical protein
MLRPLYPNEKTTYQALNERFGGSQNRTVGGDKERSQNADAPTRNRTSVAQPVNDSDFGDMM